jgi:hypothetical protein
MNKNNFLYQFPSVTVLISWNCTITELRIRIRIQHFQKNLTPAKYAAPDRKICEVVLICSSFQENVMQLSD